MSPPVRALVDLDAIASNYRTIRERVGPNRLIYAVVKADAYGHGAPAVARRLAAEGVERFAVAHTEEGVALRRAGVRGECCCSRTPSRRTSRASGHTGLTRALRRGAGPGRRARVGRPGGALRSTWSSTPAWDAGRPVRGPRRDDRAAPGVAAARLAGTFANLSSADDPSSPETGRQIAALTACIERLRAAGMSSGTVHAANSAGVLGHPGAWLDAVRPGLALYGVPPSPAFRGAGLVPAMALETTVVAVRRVPPTPPGTEASWRAATRPSP
jgi:alanine racemase